MSEDVDVVSFLLLPLAGPEEFTVEENDELPVDLQYLPSSKQRESNKEIIILLIESLFQVILFPVMKVMVMNGNGNGNESLASVWKKRE